MSAEETVGAYRSRLERLMQMLQARTDADGQARPGFKSNVAHLRAEIEMYQEKIAEAENGN